ncbi:MAG: phenylacetate--CoA ligase [Nitrososphaerota archaeon]|jgi:phenylacetate-CoA ligase|nr:phenylacetate--CoA ligase [Nitrososphaerota archaeon]
MERYWNKTIETMNREQIQALQLEKLRATVQNVYTHVPYYRKKMQEKGIVPEDIKTLDNLSNLPITTKQDLRNTYPFGMFAVPMEDIIRIHASSGTTGKQTVVGYTRRDLDIWAECMARCLVMEDANTSSRVQIAYGYGLFTGGLGAHYGVEKLGATVIPASSGNTQRQITMLIDFGVTHLYCTPSYALNIAEVMREMGHTKDEMKLVAGSFGAEPWSNAIRTEIESLLGLRAHDIYGLSEIMGPAVSHECRHQNGLHIWEDCFIAEITNPDTGEPVREGEAGDLVITTINKEGIPLIRYKTRDICTLNYEPCECGRTHVRMSKPAGRTDDMLIIRGVNVFPSQIESALLSIGEVQPHYQILVDRVNNLDTLTIEIELNDEMFSDNVKGIEEFEKKVSRQINSVLGINAKIHLVEPKSIARSEGKAKRVIDRRNI